MQPAQTSPCPSGIPRIAAATIPRVALLHRLDALAPVTVVHGLSGSGKTTLAADWAEHRRAVGDQVHWINAADTANPHAILHALTSTGYPSRRRIVIIDDAHYLTAPDVLGKIVTATAASDLHLVVCTRVAHPLTAMMSQASIETTVLTGRSLNITADEVRTFAHSWGHEITINRATWLYEELGGWIGAIRYALDNADPHHDPDGMRAVANHLREDILPHIVDEDTLTAVMVIAATGHVTLPLLTRIFAPHGPARHLPGSRTLPELLEDLTRHGLLEPAHSDDGPIWQHPTLLATILTGILETNLPELARHVHATTASWLAEQPSIETDGLRGLIVAHARAAEDWTLLARMWNEHGLCLTIHHPKQAHAAYYDIPDRIVAEYPELALASSVISALEPGMDERRRQAIISNYRQAGWVIHALPLPPATPSILEATAQMIAARYYGDVFAANSLAAECAATYLEPRGSEASLLHRAWFKLQWAITAFAAREASHAIELLASASFYARLVGADAIVSAATAQLALINAVAGHTRTASDFLAEHEATHTENQWLHHLSHAAARLAEGLLLLDQLDPRAADCFDFAGADNLEEWAIIAWARTQYALLFDDPILAMTEVNRLASLHHRTTLPDSSNQRVIDRCIADLYLALGELNRAERHIQDAGAHQLTLAVPRARLAFICGDYATARSIAAAHAWDPSTTLRDRIDLVILKAACAHRMGDIDSARLLMSRAVHLAADIDTLIPYTALPEQLCHDLLALVDHTLDDDALARIDAHRQPYPEHGELVVLSPRETVVLYAMVEHETLADIADTLVVSLNTVKKQAHSIHAKLGVHDRQAALLQAHRLGLLPEPVRTTPNPTEPDPTRDTDPSAADTATTPGE